MTITEIDMAQEGLILSAAVAAAFNYYNIPNIGADIDPCILKGFQSGLGAMAGVTATFFFNSGRKSEHENTLIGILNEWFGPKSSTGRSKNAWKVVMWAAFAGTLSCLLVPDNQTLQAASVFITPIMHRWNDGLP